MSTLSEIAVHPIKALDPVELDRVGITDIGGLEGDRTYAIVDENGEYVNGKRTAKVHRLRTTVDLDTGRLEIRVEGTDEKREFHLEKERRNLERWLSSYFDVDVELESGVGGFRTDSVIYGDETKTGPTLISEATLREVASWYPDIEPQEMRLRLRPNLVLEDVPPFWEDRLITDGGSRLRIGDVTLEVTRPIPRCVVPTRDPKTGDVSEAFRETFLENREETLPEDVDRDIFDGNLFSLTVGTRIPKPERGRELAVGDEVRLVETDVDSFPE